jgi:hypothetical protein
VKTVHMVMGPDGEVGFRNSTAINARASLACTLMAATITSDVLKQHLTDEQRERINPRKIAALACDLANAVYDEFEEREWIMQAPLPEGVTDLGSM